MLPIDVPVSLDLEMQCHILVISAMKEGIDALNIPSGVAIKTK